MSPCRFMDLGDGRKVIFCGSFPRKTPTNPEPCAYCGKPSTRLCDYPLTGLKTGQTCDARICEDHATRAGPDTDYCPKHAGIISKKEPES